MERVQTGHSKIEREENLSLLRSLHCRTFGDRGVAALRCVPHLFRDVAFSWFPGYTAAPGIEPFADNVSGNMALVVLIGVLLGLHAQKDRAQHHGANEKPDLRATFALLRRPDRHRHSEAAGDQD